MRVLLPPSEAKNPGGRGRPLDSPVAARGGPDVPLAGLTAPRRAVRVALERLLHGDQTGAVRDLLLPAGVADDALERNAAIGTSATTPALLRYAGVLYAGLAYPIAPDEIRRAARRSVLIFSGLFGVVRGGDRIPDYRVPAKAVLPGLGVAATYWRGHLEPLLAGADGARLLGRGLIVDLRSSDYAAMWRPTGAHRERTLTVRVLSPLPRGGHGVVSYNSKFAKGQLTAALLRATVQGDEPRTADDVARIWVSSGGRDAQPGRVGLDLYTG